MAATHTESAEPTGSLTPLVDDVRDMLSARLAEPDLSTSVQAVMTVVREYLREVRSDRPTCAGLWPSVEAAASLGLPATVLERSLWRAHVWLLDRMLHQESADTARSDRRAVSSFTLECCAAVAREYGLSERAEQTHRQLGALVNQLVCGETSDPEFRQAARALDLRGSDTHWATVLWSSGSSAVAVDDQVEFAWSMARSVGDARPLVVPHDTSEVWMWTRWAEPPKPDVTASVYAQLCLPDGLRVCSGPVLPGLTGVRRSMLVARAVQRAVGVVPGTGWHDHAETTPVSLLVKERDWADWFVEHTLGGLSSRDAWSSTLRETLRLYLARGRSRQQVAADMFINRNTVAYRVQKAEQLLGKPIDDDTFLLRLALEMARLHSADDRSSVDPAAHDTDTVVCVARTP